MQCRVVILLMNIVVSRSAAVAGSPVIVFFIVPVVVIVVVIVIIIIVFVFRAGVYLKQDWEWGCCKRYRSMECPAARGSRIHCSQSHCRVDLRARQFNTSSSSPCSLFYRGILISTTPPCSSSAWSFRGYRRHVIIGKGSCGHGSEQRVLQRTLLTKMVLALLLMPLNVFCGACLSTKNTIQQHFMYIGSVSMRTSQGANAFWFSMKETCGDASNIKGTSMWNVNKLVCHGTSWPDDDTWSLFSKYPTPFHHPPETGRFTCLWLHDF